MYSFEALEVKGERGASWIAALPGDFKVSRWK
jgi:hypothetical protein